MGGKLVYGPREFSVDCTIRDLTEAGAHLRLASDAPLTDPIWLIVIRSGVAHHAQVAWRKPPEVGLRFDQTIDLRQHASGPLLHLHRLWVECSER